jgi:hypothetical protein
MRKISLLLFGVAICNLIYAQTEKGYVFLKNGSVVKGKYIYSSDKQKLNVQSAGNLWIFESHEIDSIVSKRQRLENHLEQDISTSIFFYRTEIGVLAGNAENSQSAPFSVTGSINYKITQQASVGAGFGVEFLKESYLPLYANFEYKFRQAWSTPFVFVKAGYQVAIEDSRELYYDVYPPWASYVPWPAETENENLKAKGGILFNPGVGYQRIFSSGFGMSLAMGYQFHRLQYKGEEDYHLDIDYNRLSIRIGIIF